MWIIDDLRDGTPVGAVRGSLYLPAGYVKANGATVQRADYPRLVALADRYHLWTGDATANAGLFGRGDGAATMVLPNWTDRMIQLAADGTGASVAAGLPNITGVIPIDTGIYGASVCDFVGAIYDTDEGMKYSHLYSNGGYGKSNHRIMRIDASRANPIYGASDTVQPAAIKLIPVIRY